MPDKPIEILLKKAEFKCLACGAKMGTCDCWVYCACGWHYRKDEVCENPIHGQVSTL